MKSVEEATVFEDETLPSRDVISTTVVKVETGFSREDVLYEGNQGNAPSQNYDDDFESRRNSKEEVSDENGLKRNDEPDVVSQKLHPTSFKYLCSWNMPKMLTLC